MPHPEGFLRGGGQGAEEVGLVGPHQCGELRKQPLPLLPLRTAIVDACDERAERVRRACHC